MTVCARTISLSPLLLLSSEVSVQSSALPPSYSQLGVLSHSRSHLFAASAPYQSFSNSHLVSLITFLSKILPSICPPLRMLLFLALVLLCSPVSKRWACPFLHNTPLSSPFFCPRRGKVGELVCRQNSPQLLRLDGHLLRQLLLRVLPLLRYDSNQLVLSSLYPVASRGR